MTLDSIEFRNALGQFPTGVCVVTASPDGYAPFGMTINSFASVSLDPPLILWSLQRDSDLSEAWATTQEFAVNVLNAEQQHLSQQYARKDEHDLDPAHFSEGITGVPILHDAVASFECVLEKCHDGGDHIILVGRVVEMENGEHTEPLVFHAGRYRELE